MSRAKRVRWECPNGCPGVLGSTRPPADASVRFCQSCSAASTRLVKRTAPALERQRAAKSASTAERAARKRVRAAAAERDRFVVSTHDGQRLDLREEMDAMMRGSLELRDRLREAGEPSRWRPQLVVRRGRSGTHVSGRCEWDGSVITLTVRPGSDSHDVREVLLHELVHAVTCWGLPHSGRRGRDGQATAGRDWHGSVFRTALCRSAFELWGTTVHPDDHREAYGLDGLIRAQLRERGA